MRSDDQLPVRTVLLKYCDLKNISPYLLNLLHKHSPEGSDAKKLDSLLADGVRHTIYLFSGPGTGPQWLRTLMLLFLLGFLLCYCQIFKVLKLFHFAASLN